MARIRIIDEWLRSPVSAPSRHRAVLVVADSWSEQRVLMRAFASCNDQTRPTIQLHGSELAIGPAGTDPHGEWGIHVEPPVDGRAQQLREQLETAAQRLAGSKGRPPRLVDEVSSFDKQATNLWSRGTGAATRHGYYEPAEIAPPGSSAVIPSSAAAVRTAASAEQLPAPGLPPVEGRATRLDGGVGIDRTEGEGAAAETRLDGAAGRAARSPSAGGHRDGGADSITSLPGFSVGSRAGRVDLRRTAPLWGEPGDPAPAAATSLPPTAPAASAASRRQQEHSMASLVGRTMPLGLALGDDERTVLNALGAAGVLGASDVQRLIGTDRPLEWMEALMTRLGSVGLDLIAPGDDRAGEPTYVLRR